MIRPAFYSPVLNAIIMNMGRVIRHPAGICRHEKYGRCTNEFWTIMKRAGKPGLAEYTCLVWRARLKALEVYHQAAWRADRFGLSGYERRRVLDRSLPDLPGWSVTCPRYRPEPGGTSAVCRYYYLEACLLEFPLCPGTCEDFMPRGDQRG